MSDHEPRDDTRTVADNDEGDTVAERYDRDSDDSHTGLLWFSVLGAIILGLLWIIDVTGLFGLTWTLLGATTTLVLAVVAAVGAALFWYDSASGETAA
jgi:hypothetical protein